MLTCRRILLAVLAVLLTAGLASSAPITITMLADYQPASLRWQQEMAAEYMRLHPDTKIDLVPTTGSTVAQKMQVMLASNTPLDIGFMDPYVVINFVKQGVLEDLTPYFEKDKAHFQDFYPPVLDIFRYNQGLYAVPFDMQLAGTFYNVDLFRAAGLAQPKTNWTYEDMMAAAKRLTLRGSDGTILRYGYRIPSNRNWVPVIWAFGGDLVDDWTEPTRFLGNQPAVAQALDYLAEMVRAGAAPNKSLNSKFPLAGGFANQTIAIVQSNTYSMDSFYPIDSFEWNTAPLPTGPAGHATYVNAIGWFMFNNSRYKKEAWDVLKFFTSREISQKRIEMVGSVPPSTRLFQNVWLPSKSMPKDRHLLLYGVEKARSPMTLSKELWTILDFHALSAIWGEAPLATALANMEAQVNAALSAAIGK